MTILEIIILAIALAIDATLVSFSYGLILTEKRVINACKMAFAFGFFQFLMPLIGWFLTGYVYEYIKNYSKWIVCAVFIFLAVKFLIEAFSKDKEETITCISLYCLLGLAVATSIDALGAGISIRLLSLNILLPAILIGIITFILSISGFGVSQIFKQLNKKIALSISALMFLYLAVKAIL